jgi:hypothetical protein
MTQQQQLAAAFERLALAANRAAAPSWIDLCTWPSVADGTATVSGVSGAVRSHTKGGRTVFRFIPTPYNAALDGFYSTFTGGVLSGLIAARG